MHNYCFWDDPFSYTMETFDFFLFHIFKIMLRFNKYMKVIHFYWADIPEIPAFMSKLIKIENLLIKNHFCNDPYFIFRFLASY